MTNIYWALFNKKHTKVFLHYVMLSAFSRSAFEPGETQGGGGGSVAGLGTFYKKFFPEIKKFSVKI